ncbi:MULTISPECIES: serine hydrolase [unclassified Microbacterium]|uniref:serine hydrolase n=1 Tax=unclassified Microbacterium TaxID=2609290 RepID=UPI0016052B03|nr:MULTISPECIES: serine hydrolase [unclassified Microbacterium]QNA92863.1 serine hydrolase [Microbacterium sp. Se63.02b]QYM63013.1 class A beta-lactamase-related serine hydrolase [Microbacterium sp. Se5.02b]
MITLPPLDPRVTWSVRLLDADTGDTLAEHDPHTQCETASIGKIFLLLEVARRLEDGIFSSDDRIEIPDEHQVEDSGLLYRMQDQRVTVHDAALLVGAVSDNLATNALIHLCGLDQVRAVAPALGYRATSLHDYIRNERTPDLPWTPSYGTAAELSDVMRRLGTGDAFSPAVSARVLDWLAADTDTSMTADAFLVDPLAHVEAEYQGMVLRHKTGSVGFARVDVGLLRGPEAAIAYAVAANWKGSPVDLRAPVLDDMRAIGERIRAQVTARARDESAG